MLEESITIPATSDNSFPPKFSYINNFKIAVTFEGNLKQDKLSFTHRNAVNNFIVYELDTWSRKLNADFKLKDFLFGVVQLIKYVDPDKYFYTGYGIRSDSRSFF